MDSAACSLSILLYLSLSLHLCFPCFTPLLTPSPFGGPPPWPLCLFHPRLPISSLSSAFIPPPGLSMPQPFLKGLSSKRLDVTRTSAIPLGQCRPVPYHCSAVRCQLNYEITPYVLHVQFQLGKRECGSLSYHAGPEAEPPQSNDADPCTLYVDTDTHQLLPLRLCLLQRPGHPQSTLLSPNVAKVLPFQPPCCFAYTFLHPSFVWTFKTVVDAASGTVAVEGTTPPQGTRLSQTTANAIPKPHFDIIHLAR